MDDAVRRSLEHCHAVTRTRARNFYYGLKLTPGPKRAALYAIYAFMRACDDIADEAASHAGGAAAGLERIEAFRADMQRVLDQPAGAALPAGPIWPAFQYVVRTYPIDPAHLHAMLDGQRDDLVGCDYRTFEDLYAYCYKVASVVGLVCISIWGHTDDPAVLKMAEHRGIAFQLTNILRDLVEDVDRGRVYLPNEELERFGYTPELLKSRTANGAFDRLMAFQIDRARAYYTKSAALDEHIDAKCRPTSWALMRIYRDLLEKLAKSPRRVLTRRVRLSSIHKARIALGAAWSSKR